jgi:hypothetical protein
MHISGERLGMRASLSKPVMYGLACGGLLHTIVSSNLNHAASIDDLANFFVEARK